MRNLEYGTPSAIDTAPERKELPNNSSVDGALCLSKLLREVRGTDPVELDEERAHIISSLVTDSADGVFELECSRGACPKRSLLEMTDTSLEVVAEKGTCQNVKIARTVIDDFLRNFTVSKKNK